MSIYVIGYGTMSAGILPHVEARYPGLVRVISKHVGTQNLRGHRFVPLETLMVDPPTIVCTFSTDDDSSRATWNESVLNDALVAYKPVCVELGTVSPARMKQWHKEMDARGLEHVEAPVTGSRWGGEIGIIECFPLQRR